MPMILSALLMLQAAPACTAIDTPPPAGFAHWGDAPAKLLAADAAPFIVPTLDPAASAPVTGAPPPRPGRVASIMFQVAKAGRYRLAIDQKAWIDVRPISSNAPLVSVDHGHGPACSSITKFVAFDLAPGSYYLDLSGAPADKVKVILTLAQ